MSRGEWDRINEPAERLVVLPADVREKEKSKVPKVKQTIRFPEDEDLHRQILE